MIYKKEISWDWKLVVFLGLECQTMDCLCYSGTKMSIFSKQYEKVLGRVFV